MKVYVDHDEDWPVLVVSGVQRGLSGRVEVPAELIDRYNAAHREWKAAQQAIREHLKSTDQRDMT